MISLSSASHLIIRLHKTQRNPSQPFFGWQRSATISPHYCKNFLISYLYISRMRGNLVDAASSTKRWSWARGLQNLFWHIFGDFQ